PLLGSALCEVARRRPPPISPSRTNLPLYLSAVGKPVLRVPDGPAHPLYPEHMTARNPRRLLHDHWIVRRSWDILGTRAPAAELPNNEKTSYLRGFLVGREGLEPSTLGLRVPCSTS